ncbi:MAG: hypothetical protein Q4B81_00130 [Moraxella sp.]|nr:hypothetical protein [Moraxella sp.]
MAWLTIILTPFIIDGVEYGARIVVRGDGNGNFYYDFQVASSVDVIVDGMEIKNPLSRDIPYDWEATSNGFANHYRQSNSQSQSLFDDTGSKMVLNLFIFDKDGNEIGE